MAMQSQLYTINGLATELGHDRRSLARWLDDLPAAQTDADGTKRWRLRDVLDHIDAKNRAPSLEESVRRDYAKWLGEMLFPALFSSKNVVSIFTGGLRGELGLSKAQALRAYQIMLLAVSTELVESLPGIRIRVPPLAERLAEKGVDQVVREQWPD